MKEHVRPKRKTSATRKKKSLRDRGLELGILFLFLVLVLFFYSIVYQRWFGPVQEQPVPVEQRVIRVEVLNGCGVAGLAREVTDFLRLKSFDVVNVGNAETFDFPETMVVDRVGNMPAAWRVARVVGVDNVIQQKDEDLLLDVTLILGRDYEQLLPLQATLGGDE
jgi:hypothetical protein